MRWGESWAATREESPCPSPDLPERPTLTTCVARAQRDGVRLQNMVYYRSTGAFTSAPSSAEPCASATHYFVMTAEADSLLAAGD